MRILIIPDSFKECLTATEVADAIHKGVVSVLPSAFIKKIPFSDGGEGALEVLTKSIPGNLVTCQTENALGNKIQAKYFLFKEKKTAWIELSNASGLAQIPIKQRNAMKASTYGTGLMIKDALAKGCKEIILGLGGSATTDGGAGIFQALGGKLLDQNGKSLEKGGAFLIKLSSIINPSFSEKIEWKVACDVISPLLGNLGAAYVYGPQKGASSDEVKLLNKSLDKLSNVIYKHYSRDIKEIKGGGAAGGTAAGMLGFFGASLTSGFSILAEMINLEKEVKKADLILTAEGKIDSQSTKGKLTGSIAHLAKKNNVKIIGIAGAIKGPYEHLYKKGFTGVFPIQNGPISLEESIKNTRNLITDTASRIIAYHLNNKKKP